MNWWINSISDWRTIEVTAAGGQTKAAGTICCRQKKEMRTLMSAGVGLSGGLTGEFSGELSGGLAGELTWGLERSHSRTHWRTGELTGVPAGELADSLADSVRFFSSKVLLETRCDQRSGSRRSAAHRGSFVWRFVRLEVRCAFAAYILRSSKFF